MSKPKHLIFCPKCNKSKILFETEKQAELFIRYNAEDIGNSNRKNKKPVRSYYCDVCGGYHVTSIPKWNNNRDKHLTDDIITLYRIEKGQGKLNIKHRR